jgi:hypothetical protein
MCWFQPFTQSWIWSWVGSVTISWAPSIFEVLS